MSNDDDVMTVGDALRTVHSFLQVNAPLLWSNGHKEVRCEFEHVQDDGTIEFEYIAPGSRTLQQSLFCLHPARLKRRLQQNESPEDIFTVNKSQLWAILRTIHDWVYS